MRTTKAFGQGSGNIWLDNLGCSGTESYLGNYSHNGWGVHNCAHFEDASVRWAGTYLINLNITTVFCLKFTGFIYTVQRVNSVTTQAHEVVRILILTVYSMQ